MNNICITLVIAAVAVFMIALYTDGFASAEEAATQPINDNIPLLFSADLEKEGLSEIALTIQSILYSGKSSEEIAEELAHIIMVGETIEQFMVRTELRGFLQWSTGTGYVSWNVLLVPRIGLGFQTITESGVIAVIARSEREIEGINYPSGWIACLGCSSLGNHRIPANNTVEDNDHR